MKKEMYIGTELDIIRFTTQDIIMTTGEIPTEGEELPGGAP